MSSVARFPAPGKTANETLSCARFVGATLMLFLAAWLIFSGVAEAQTAGKPNILVIFGDDVGPWNISA